MRMLETTSRLQSLGNYFPVHHSALRKNFPETNEVEMPEVMATAGACSGLPAMLAI